MIYLPVTLLLFLLLLLLLPFVWFVLAVDVVELAVAKLGFSPDVAFLLLVAVLLGSTINIPLYERVSEVSPLDELTERWLAQFWGIPWQRIERKTIIALNLGGGLIPIGLALYELTRTNIVAVLGVTAVVALVSYWSSHVVPGIGIQMNPLVGPLAASLTAVIVAGEAAPPIAFAGGVLGVLIGADLLHLPKVQRMTSGVLSIGGAGVFDGIALCGLFALLLT